MSRKLSKSKTKVTKITKKKNPQFKAGDRVEVQWEDAYGSSGWDLDPSSHAPHDVSSVGYVVFYDKRGIKLASGFHEWEDGSKQPLGISFVPKGMIRKITKI